jgi:hypothetical protein
MTKECKHLDRLMYAIANYHAEPKAITEALVNFQKYGKKLFEEKEPLSRENKSSSNDIQVGGSHYKAKTIQPWDFIAANQIGYFEGNVVKYVSRWRDKGGVDDLRKARHYLDKLIELETKLEDNAA